jgi:hypothetical protein
MPLRRTDLAPPFSWEALRDAYTARFGDLIEVHEAYDWPAEPIVVDGSAGDDDDAEAEDYPRTPEEEAAEREAFLAEISREMARAREAKDKAMEADADKDEDPEPRHEPVAYYTLWFRSRGQARPRFVTATFGAAPYTGGFELFLTSAIPIRNFDSLLTELVESTTPLEPNKRFTIPLGMGKIPLEAALVLPASKSGSSIGRGVRALQVVPVTPWEWVLGGRSMDALVLSLEAEGVIEETDPLRNCVVSPGETRKFWARQRPVLLSRLSRKLRAVKARRDELVSQGASAARIAQQEQAIQKAELLLRHVESRELEPEDAAFAAWAAERGRQIVEVFQRLFQVLGPTLSALPDELRWTCQDVLGLALVAHPLADRLLREIVGDAALPQELDAEDVLRRAVSWFRENRPGAPESLLLAAGRDGLAAASRQTSAGDGALPWHVAWTSMAKHMFGLARDDLPERGESRVDVMAVGIEAVSDALAFEALGAPPFDRLVAVVTATVSRMSARHQAHIEANERLRARKGQRGKYH